MQSITITQGDSSPVKKISINTYPDLSATEWTGKTVVKKELGQSETSLIDRILPKDPEEIMFLGYLTPDETASLAPGMYYLTHQIENSTLLPPFRKEFQFELEVKPQGA